MSMDDVSAQQSSRRVGKLLHEKNIAKNFTYISHPRAA